ncbi:MAG: hypothetical protein ACT4ON_11080 [Bacteroidota bacterium]
MRNIYNQRLLTFAKHLAVIKQHPEMGLFGTVNLVNLEIKKRTHYKIKYHEWVFEELPGIFDDWFFTEKYGNPMWEGINEENGTVEAAIDFFGLNLFEFSHLFDVEGLQYLHLFGGEKLSENSNGPVISKNIIQLVNSRISRP